MRSLIIFTLSIPLVLAGCAESKFVGRPGLNYVPMAEMPAPTRQDMTVEGRPYVLGPADEISIEVFGVPDLTRKVVVDTSGQISLPLAGTFQVSGMTAPELAAVVRDRLLRQVRDPKVSVNVVTTASQAVAVDGEVESPGLYQIQGRMSLMRVIARAGGMTEFSRQNYVVLFRRANGQDYATLYDVRAIRAGAYADPEVFANDIVVVGESRARRVFKDVLAASGLITAPIVALVR